MSTDANSSPTINSVILTQVASWNTSLTNPYRTLYAESGGRFFKVSAGSPIPPAWYVEELNEDGTTVARPLIDNPDYRNVDDWDFGFSSWVFTLAEARAEIAAAIARGPSPLTSAAHRDCMSTDADTSPTINPVTLTQVASRNTSPTNPYRTRYATSGGRFFKVSASSLDSAWYVEELNEDGTTVARPLIDNPDYRNVDDWDFGFSSWVFTLAEARTEIAAAIARGPAPTE